MPLKGWKFTIRSCKTMLYRAHGPNGSMEVSDNTVSILSTEFRFLTGHRRN